MPFNLTLKDVSILKKHNPSKTLNKMLHFYKIYKYDYNIMNNKEKTKFRAIIMKLFHLLDYDEVSLIEQLERKHTVKKDKRKNHIKKGGIVYIPMNEQIRDIRNENNNFYKVMTKKQYHNYFGKYFDS